MKKKLIIAMCMALAISACGCGKEDIANTVGSIKEKVEDTVDSVAESDSDEYFLKSDSILYTVDSKGNKTSECNLADYKDTFFEHGISFTDNATFLGFYDGAIFFSMYEYTDDGSKETIYAMDADSRAIVTLMTTELDFSSTAVDFYKGKIYVDVRKYDPNTQKEFVFVKKDDSFEFTEEESEINKIIENANGKYVDTCRYDASMMRSYDECGFLITGEIVDEDTSAWSFYKATMDGEEPIKNLQKVDGYLESYNKDWAFLGDVNSDDLITDCYSLNGDEKHTLKCKEPVWGALFTAPEGFYYYEATEKEYGVNDYQIYFYDVAADSSKLLYKTSSTIGAGNFRPGVEEFKVIDGKIYAQQLFKDTIGWACYDESSGVLKDVELPIKEVTPLKYGTINYGSSVSKCGKCGTVISKNYTENFVLDSKYSEHAAEINKILEPNSSGDEIVDEPNTYCDEHQEDPDSYCETSDWKVSDVAIINDRFLTVNMSGYWYGGGAHGMPSAEQRIFDLTTGEELSLENFYSGTETQFKEMVAQKVRDDYEKSQASQYKYFAESADEAYNQAYEYTTLSAMFYDDHATYSFPPYMIGPYASGFIDIDLTYTELFGTDKLTRIK